jgi:hypothetical protein
MAWTGFLKLRGKRWIQWQVTANREIQILKFSHRLKFVKSSLAFSRVNRLKSDSGIISVPVIWMQLDPNDGDRDGPWCDQIRS